MSPNQERGNIILARFGMSGLDLQNRLEALQRVVLQDKQRLMSANPVRDLSKDARLVAINNLFMYLGRTRMMIHFLGELLDDDWCDANMPGSLQKDRIIEAVSFEKMIKYSFGMDFFTSIETSLRIFLRTLDPTACKNGTGPFKSIFEHLLGPKQLNLPAQDRNDAIELLNFVRVIRNLIHSGSVYFADDGKDTTLNYRGKTYTLRHGYPADFVYWELLLTLADDIRQLMVKIVYHPKLASIPQITDPYAAHSW